ncbi:ParA family protein [Pseudomonas sp. NPDC089569]|uniref:ParA family protein n=1 Tax=Pseudomonas sp. NPDC089569 TaxID=3390722 RepID=UPI003CFE279F
MSRKRRNRGRGKIIVITNQKGGVGKTTIAYHLLCFLYDAGFKVLGIDLDGQGNFSSRFMSKEDRIGGYRAVHMFNAEPTPFKPLVTPYGPDLIYSLNRDVELFQVESLPLFDAVSAFNDKIDGLCEEYDFIVVDTPPSYGNKMAAACVVQDFLFVPVELAAFAVEGVVSVVESVKEIGAMIQEEIKITGVICNKLRHVNSHQQALTEMRNEAGVGNMILKTNLVNRGAVDDALRDGAPVWRRRTSGAERTTAKEMTALMSEMAGLCGIKVSSKGASK